MNIEKFERWILQCNKIWEEIKRCNYGRASDGIINLKLEIESFCQIQKEKGKK